MLRGNSPMKRIFVSHSYFATSSVPSPFPFSRIGERPLEKDCANFGRRNAFTLSPVIYVWHLGRVCSMTWHKYLHVKFFLAQVMPLTSVCLLSLTLSSLFIALFLTQKKSNLFYFDFVHALSSCSPHPAPSPAPLSLSAFGGYHGDKQN